MIERFTPTSAGSMDYTITVDDPAYYPVVDGLDPDDEGGGTALRVRCHEGNYGLRGIMAGHRKEEEEKASSADAPQR